VKGGEKEYEAELAQLVYQNAKDAVLKLAIYEKENEAALAYSWANAEAERIGINLRWIQTGFTRK